MKPAPLPPAYHGDEESTHKLTAEGRGRKAKGNQRHPPEQLAEANRHEDGPFRRQVETPTHKKRNRTNRKGGETQPRWPSRRTATQDAKEHIQDRRRTGKVWEKSGENRMFFPRPFQQQPNLLRSWCLHTTFSLLHGLLHRNKEAQHELPTSPSGTVHDHSSNTPRPQAP